MLDKPILITGISGFIGGHIWSALADQSNIWGTYCSRGKQPLNPDRQRYVDLLQPDSFTDFLIELRPRCILHLAALGGPAICQKQSLLAWRVNNTAVRYLAKAAEKIKARVILASTDQVFDGLKGSYREGDKPNPINIYGDTKKAAERSLFATVSNSVVVRINNTYGRPTFGGSSFSEWILDRVGKGEPVPLYINQYRSLIDIVSLTQALVELIDHPFKGLLHLGGANRVNRVTFGRKLLQHLGYDTSGIVSLESTEHDPEGIMPFDTSFDITLARQVLNTRLPGIEEGIALTYDSE